MVRNWREEDRQNAGQHENFAKNVVKWLEQGYTSLELCFVWVEESVIRGGIAFEISESEKIYILDFSLSFDSFHLGVELLNQSLKRASVQCACYHLYNDNKQYKDYKKCFQDAGFSVIQEKLSYRFNKETLEHREDKITFRSYTDVGEKDFEQAVILVTQHTLDRIDANSVFKYGSSEAARICIKELKEIDFQPEIWMLAYIDDELIGLVIPSNFGNAYGAINYIGIVPRQRGKGYVDSLLNKGTRLLLNQGVTSIIADIDNLNFPMKDALERFGYEFSSEETVFEKIL